MTTTGRTRRTTKIKIFTVIIILKNPSLSFHFSLHRLSHHHFVLFIFNFITHKSQAEKWYRSRYEECGSADSSAIFASFFLLLLPALLCISCNVSDRISLHRKIVRCFVYSEWFIVFFSFGICDWLILESKLAKITDQIEILNWKNRSSKN